MKVCVADGAVVPGAVLVSSGSAEVVAVSVVASVAVALDPALVVEAGPTVVEEPSSLSPSPASSGVEFSPQDSAALDTELP